MFIFFVKKILNKYHARKEFCEGLCTATEQTTQTFYLSLFVTFCIGSSALMMKDNNLYMNCKLLLMF